MATDITTKAAPPPMKPASGAIRNGLLAAMTPNTLDDAFRLSKALAMSGDMVPKHFQGKPEAVMAALLQGASIGLPPMQSLQYIAVINGRPSVWGDALPALVMAAGHFVDVELAGEGEQMVATATLTRKDGRKVVRRFSMADAKRAGLAGKQGPWQQYPGRMLQMRARAWAVRDGAPDALVGLSIAEEVQDYGPDAARDVTPDNSIRQSRRVTFVPAETAAPAVDEIHEAEAEVVEADHPHAGLARMLMREAENGAPGDEIRKLYADDLAQMKAEAPDLFAQVDGALKGERA